MGLDIFIRRAKNSNSTIEQNFTKFFEEFDENSTVEKMQELAKKYGVLDRLNIETSSYIGEGEQKVSYVTAGRTDMEDAGYFRKHNHLVAYFKYEENCSDKELAKCEVKDCITACKQVLKHWGKDDFESVAEELMPTESGFFFGSTEYDEYYKEKLEEDIKVFTNVLKNTDWDNDIVYFHCWW